MKKTDYKYYILADHRLLVEVLSGSFEFSQYIILKQVEFDDPEFDPNFNRLIDVRNIDDPSSAVLIREYMTSIKPLQQFTKRIKAAVLTSSPSQVVGASLYKHYEKAVIDCKIFSTPAAAFEWLGLNPDDLEDLEYLQ